jgi:hypothetical protein
VGRQVDGEVGGTSRTKKAWCMTRLASLTILVGVLVAAASCGRSGTSVSSMTTVPPKTNRPSEAPQTLNYSNCSDAQPCRIPAGTYALGPNEVVPGLTLTLPAGWTSPEMNYVNVIFAPPSPTQGRVSLWVDMSAVKSTGAGHGVTILNHVGQTPRDLVKWMTTNPDFSIVARPTRTHIGDITPATTLALGVSKTAHYGDSGCPANPRCADLFTRAGNGPDFYGIGGLEQVRLYVANSPDVGASFIVALDAPNHHDLINLTNAAAQIIHSIHERTP